MAIEAGCDLVLGLPYTFGTAPAERFAQGGVETLSRLGAVTHLCFGVEESALDLFHQLSDVSADQRAFKAAMAEGLSYAEAKAIALSKSAGLTINRLNLPNLNLALAYRKAVKQLKSKLIVTPFPVKAVITQPQNKPPPPLPLFATLWFTAIGRQFKRTFLKAVIKSSKNIGQEAITV